MAQLHAKNRKRRNHFLSGCALWTLVAASGLLSWQDVVRAGPLDDVRPSSGTTIAPPEVQAGPREEDARAGTGTTIATIAELLDAQAGTRSDAPESGGKTIAKLPEGAMAPKKLSWLGSDIGARKITAPVVEPSPPEDEEIALLVAYRVSDSELEAMRGGFVTPSGLVINIGITGLVFVNGTLVSTIPIFNSFVLGDTGVVASGVNVTRGDNGGLVVTTNIDIVPDIVAVGAGGADVELITGPAGTQVIHHISASGLAVEVINTNNNLFLQTQTDVVIVLENMALTLQLSGAVNDLNQTLSSGILGALGN